MQMSQMQDYYGRLLATQRSGGPTAREARTDYVRTIRQSLPYTAL